MLLYYGGQLARASEEPPREESAHPGNRPGRRRGTWRVCALLLSTVDCAFLSAVPSERPDGRSGTLPRVRNHAQPPRASARRPGASSCLQCLVRVAVAADCVLLLPRLVPLAHRPVVATGTGAALGSPEHVRRDTVICHPAKSASGAFPLAGATRALMRQARRRAVYTSRSA